MPYQLSVTVTDSEGQEIGGGGRRENVCVEREREGGGVLSLEQCVEGKVRVVEQALEHAPPPPPSIQLKYILSPSRPAGAELHTWVHFTPLSCPSPINIQAVSIRFLVVV